MTVDRTKIETNLRAVMDRIGRAARRSGRSPDMVRLVAVTKTVGIDEVNTLFELGVAEVGENRVEEAREKIGGIPGQLRWHMVGNIQRRKARDVAALFDYVDAVDRTEVAETLDRHCEALQKRLPILIEVNVSGEPTKHGFSPDELDQVVDRCRALVHLDVQGLMTMAPLVDDPERVRPVFAALRTLGERLQLAELSMGMSNDFEVAIEEGATQVRIGTALFAHGEASGT